MNPILLSTPFASSGDKNTIPESESSQPQDATWEKGFPPITQTPISEGGIPPERRDFNGALNAITQNIVFQTRGGRYKFDPTYANKIGGYPVNAVLQLESGAEVINKTPNNTTNPNVDMTGWGAFGGGIKVVESIADMLAIEKPKDGDVVYVKGYHKPSNLALVAPYMGGGLFIYDSSKSTINDSVVSFGGWIRQFGASLDVTDGGAIPDLKSAQHVELKRTFEACRNHGIKKMTFTAGVYLIGEVGKNNGTLFDIWGATTDPKPMLNFTVDARGATIKQIDGVRFGRFNGVNETPFTHIFNNTACTGFTLKNIEIDGNNTKAEIGGKFGDHGWQIPNYGIRLISGYRNSLENVYVHHMLLDNIYLGRLASSRTKARDDLVFSRVRSEYAGRQALSIGGVRGLTGIGCAFNYTGQGGLMSAPAAGIDFENELGAISDVAFYNTEVRGNAGHDLHFFNLYGDFDVSNIQFFGGKIIAEGKSINPLGGTQECGCIGANPTTAVTFNGTLIGGKILREGGGTTWLLDASRMMKYRDCMITDDETLTQITLDKPKDPMIIDSGEHNFAFSGCTIRVTDKKIKLGQHGKFDDNTIEAKFTKKLDGHFLDTLDAYRFRDNILFNFDKTAFGNTVNFSAWNNKTNRIVNGDAVSALTWLQSGSDGYSLGVISLGASANINTAFTSINSVFEQDYKLQGVKINETYKDGYGTAKFYHQGLGEGTLLVNLTNFGGAMLKRTRAGGVWGGFQKISTT